MRSVAPACDASVGANAAAMLASGGDLGECTGRRLELREAVVS